MLITPEYLELNKELHARNPMYGTSSDYTNMAVYDLITSCDYRSILDYGAGKQKLEAYIMNRLLNDPHTKGIDYKFTSYDPAIPDIDTLPKEYKGADLVVCTDVLEHVEPECLQEVIGDIYYNTKKCAFFLIHLGSAKKTLADGRNAHLIQETSNFWILQLVEWFHILSLFHPDPSHLVVVCKSSREA